MVPTATYFGVGLIKGRYAGFNLTGDGGALVFSQAFKPMKTKYSCWVLTEELVVRGSSDLV